MNILREYTLDYIKRNKKSSLTIMIAILVASVLMNSVCLYAYNMWKDMVDQTIREEGDWHGELFDRTSKEDLEYVASYASVEEVMVKGAWYVAEVGDEKRPYLVMRDANKAYWNNMGEKNAIIEGHIPERRGEVAVSRQFMAAHPNYHVGDQVTLPVGKRINSQGKVIDEVSTAVPGETFEKQGERTFTIAAVLDIVTSSSVPCYTGIGYLETEDILPEDDLTLYIRFKNIRETYKELPKIAEAIGFHKDEYGNYPLRYNMSLLMRYGVLPKIKGEVNLVQFQMPIIVAFLAIILVSVFVFIIHNAFEVSMQSRIKQLGLFKSIGATPKQIKGSITFEASILSIIPIPLGIFISHIFWNFFIVQANKVWLYTDIEPIKSQSCWQLELGVVMLVLFTAWLSAYIPSRKISKQMPIAILRGEIGHYSFKRKKASFKEKSKCIIRAKKKRLEDASLNDGGKLETRLNGEMVKAIKPVLFWKRKIAKTDIYAELVGNELRTNKKAFRVASISLALSIFLLMAFLTGMANGDLVNELYYFNEMKSNICIGIQDGRPVDKKVEQAIFENPQISKAAEISQVFGSIWVSEADESDEIKAEGGLKQIASKGYFSIVERDNQFRIRTRLVGLDDETFKAYCEQIGADWRAYYDPTHIQTIVCDYTQKQSSNLRNQEYEPMLKLKENQKLTINEKAYDEDLGDYKVDTWVGKVVEVLPNWDIGANRYNITQIMPLCIYQGIVASFDERKAVNAMRTQMQIQVNEENITSVSHQLKEICGKIYDEGDYSIWNEVEDRERDEVGDRVSRLVIYFIAGLFAVIGLSNAFSTVYTSLEHRTRSFAILRSVGVPPKGINKLLIMEAAYFIKRPIIYAVCGEAIFLAFLLYMDQASFSEILPYLPIGTIAVFIGMVALAVGLAYLVGSYKIRKANITEAIKDETI